MSAPPTFARKAACAAILVAVADLLFYGNEPGWTLGGFALAWIAGLVLAVPAMRRRWPALLLALAGTQALVLIDDPSPLAWALLWSAVASAALLPRHRFDDALRWSLRLASFALAGPFRPLIDAGRLSRRPAPGGTVRKAGVLVLPVAGTLVFATLFAVANPLIGNAVSAIELPSLGTLVLHALLWGITLATVWPSLRPRCVRLGPVVASVTHPPQPSVASLILSLVAFNGLFALQNGLDVAFLWSGAALPDGMSMKDYVHRGAYPLIVTALLAGGFVIVALRPGSASAQSTIVRRLVAFWVAQNVVLVASSVLRTLRYIDESMLTEWRIAALAWMALVALGLVLIAVRLFADRSAAWLLNANAAAAGTVLLAASVVDLGAVAATWNVRHARRADRLDLCYVASLGASALLPLIELERRAGGPVLRDRARYLRLHTMEQLGREQADWHSWTGRGARRLAAARALTAAMPHTLRPAPNGRGCDGSISPPPPVLIARAPLTPEARP